MPNPADIPLLIENLSFRYRRREEPALEDIHFSALPGQILLIAGASGCGKTTLVRCINGLIPRSYKGDLQGSIRLFGQDPASLSLSNISQTVATVLQDPERQILGIRVINEVAFGLENLGLPRQEIFERVDEALDHLGIAYLRDRETFSISGGEKQKVALAGVLAMRPRILVLDEPLASLDPASAQETLSLVRSLADEGMSILMVEHRVEDVLRIRPDRVIYMKAGRIHFNGPPEDLDEHVNYHEVKLPAPLIIQHAAHTPPQSFPHPPDRSEESEPEQTLVRFDRVSFSYEEGVSVLEDINLEIRKKDVIAVLGANGAGKTTLVKHAIGLLKPSSGSVHLAPKESKPTTELSVAQIAEVLGYVFQSPSHMLFAPTVREELSFGPKNLGHSADDIQQQVERAMEIVNLKGFEDEPPLALSFGQQKRVSIAAILSMRSQIMVMDEPTAGQDYQNYLNFMDSIIRLPFEAILFITHDVDMAVIYANRVLLMHEGRIAADGSPYEVLHDFDLLQRCRIRPTSLLQANLARYEHTRQFLRAEELAHISPT